MHATPGEMKSLRSSALRIALILTNANAQSAADSLFRGPDCCEAKSASQQYPGCCSAVVLQAALN